MEHIADVDGRAAFISVYNADRVVVTYYVADPKAAGFHRYGQAPKEPMTDEQKAERKTLIINNKAWDSAETVRREWLGEFLTRKTLPKDAAQFIARGLTLHHNAVGTGLNQANSLAHKLLGVERSGYYSPDALAAIVEKTPTIALHVALAVVLGGIEESTSRWSWRTPSAHTAAYLNQIEAWGLHPQRRRTNRRREERPGTRERRVTRTGAADTQSAAPLPQNASGGSPGAAR